MQRIKAGETIQLSIALILIQGLLVIGTTFRIHVGPPPATLFLVSKALLLNSAFSFCRADFLPGLAIKQFAFKYLLASRSLTMLLRFLPGSLVIQLQGRITGIIGGNG